MIIIGGIASIRGAFLGAAFISVLPLLLSRLGNYLVGGAVDSGTIEILEKIIIGVLIIVFLIAEPQGLSALIDRASARFGLPAARPPEPDQATTNGVNCNVHLQDTARCSPCRRRWLGAAAVPRAQADEQYFPLQSYRVGPYAAGGTGFFGGFIDYMNLINTRDGGVNGVKLVWDECETQYEVERGVECYERLKTRPERRRLEPAQRRHRLRDDRPHHRRQGAADHGQPRPHRLHRRPRLPLCLPAAAEPLQRDLGHHQLHRLARGRHRQA